jgi:hypothetical protein
MDPTYIVTPVAANHFTREELWPTEFNESRAIGVCEKAQSAHKTTIRSSINRKYFLILFFEFVFKEGF